MYLFLSVHLLRVMNSMCSLAELVLLGISLCSSDVAWEVTQSDTKSRDNTRGTPSAPRVGSRWEENRFI